MNEKHDENEFLEIFRLFRKTFGWLPTSPTQLPIGVCWENAEGEVKQWNGSAFVPLVEKKKTRTPKEIRDAQLDLTGPPPPVPPGARAFIPQVPGPASELFVGPSAPVPPPTPQPTLAERLKAISRKLSGAISLDEDTLGNLCDSVDHTEFSTALAALDEITREVGELEDYQ